MSADPKLAFYLRTADEALRRRDVTRAGEIGAQAEMAGIKDARLLVLATHYHLKANAYGRAESTAAMAVKLAPDSADALGAYGFCLIATGRAREAIAYFDRALAIAPKWAPLHYNKGFAHESLGEARQARRLYKAAIGLDPNHSESYGQGAYLAALQGDWDEAREMAARAHAIDPRNVSAAFALALGDIEAGRPGDVEARLAFVIETPSIDPNARSTAHGILGDARHLMGEHGRAFESYAAKGDLLRNFYRPVQGLETQLERVHRLKDYFTKADPAQWHEAGSAPPSPVRAHAFVLGFARSGTTLLEQVLASHPRIEAMDERDCFALSYRFTESNEALDRLAAMTGAELDAYRKDYWDAARAAGMKLDRDVFVDKVPLNSVLLCLIAKLFPDAKIVFALRDPRDVVLSCFRQRFTLTQQLYEVLTLRGAAAYYDAVMSLVEAYRGVLALDIRDLRYEDLVANFDAECAGLCEFLGVEHDPKMADFAEVARGRDVGTPSATQVVRGLYAQGSGQWRAYEAQMAEVMPVLAPWLERFGYAP
ncbi:MAG: sulfotransferase [Alphaproteobacteria bacterium]|nr:sulfotransferase [Alphaproteobacteria bacterium]